MWLRARFNDLIEGYACNWFGRMSVRARVRSQPFRVVWQRARIYIIRPDGVGVWARSAGRALIGEFAWHALRVCVFGGSS